MRRLNVGCGKDIRKGWINLDRVRLPGVDVIHDITDLPLPFDKETFDEVLYQHVLEHIENYVVVLGEFHRILKPGGRLAVIVPHFTSKDAYSDPTHQRFFSAHTFRYFVSQHPRSYYFDFAFGKVEGIYIHFDRRVLYFYNYFLERIVNLNTRLQNLYEGSPLRIFPATVTEAKLLKSEVPRREELVQLLGACSDL